MSLIARELRKARADHAELLAKLGGRRALGVNLVFDAAYCVASLWIVAFACLVPLPEPNNARAQVRPRPRPRGLLEPQPREPVPEECVLLEDHVSEVRQPRRRLPPAGR